MGRQRKCGLYIIEYYVVMRKKKLLPFVTIWINLEHIMLGKINQTQKNKYRVISLIGNLEKSNPWKQRVER